LPVSFFIFSLILLYIGSPRIYIYKSSSFLVQRKFYLWKNKKKNNHFPFYHQDIIPRGYKYCFWQICKWFVYKLISMDILVDTRRINLKIYWYARRRLKRKPSILMSLSRSGALLLKRKKNDANQRINVISHVDWYKNIIKIKPKGRSHWIEHFSWNLRVEDMPFLYRAGTRQVESHFVVGFVFSDPTTSEWITLL
jgi:hypothetical protein